MYSSHLGGAGWLLGVGVLLSPAGPLATALGLRGAVGVVLWCTSIVALLLVYGAAARVALSGGCTRGRGRR